MASRRAWDGTDDPAHGTQEGVASHGTCGQDMDHPVRVFAGETGQLITAVLRPGTCPASRGALAILKRLVRLLRARWPGVAIEVRGDSGFAVPVIDAYLDAHQIPSTIGRHPRLEAMAAALAEHATQQRAETGETVRLVSEGQYEADTWERERRVVSTAEALEQGLNLRVVVTTRDDATADLSPWSTRRGDRPELGSKDRKDGCCADRLRCHRFLANQCRLLLQAAASWLLAPIRRWLARLQIPHLQLGTLRLRLITIGGWVRRRLERISLHLASSHPGEPLCQLLATRPGRS